MRFWDLRKTETLKDNKKNYKRTKPCLGVVCSLTYRQNDILKSLKNNKKEKGPQFNTQKQYRDIGPGNS